MVRVRDILEKIPFDKEAYERRHRRAVARAQLVPPETLALEPEMMLSSHADYRFQMPHEKTENFIEAYTKGYQTTFSRSVDRDGAKFVTGLLSLEKRAIAINSGRDTNCRREYSSLWACRQRADLMGIKYDSFVRLAFDSHLNVKRERLPRPNQLISGAGAEIVCDYVFRKWDEKGTQPRISFLPQYRTDNFIGLPAQRAYRDFIGGMAKSSSIGLSLAVANDLLPDDELKKLVPEEMLERAKQSAASDASLFRPVQPLDRADLYPGCFRLPLAYSEKNEVCKKCVFKPWCSKFDMEYLARRRAKEQGENDYVDRKRAQARERKAKQRERERAAKGQLGAPTKVNGARERSDVSEAE